ncbi:MAG: hypothetical protein ACKO83_14235 [Roseiflexaceae bacterium]
MSELVRLYEQCVAWLIATWDWVVAMVLLLWYTNPYHAIITTTLVAWYANGYLTIAGVVVAVIAILDILRRWALRVVRRTYYHRYCDLNRHLLTVIRLGRDDGARNMAKITTARRVFRHYFYTYQLDFTPDTALRRTMRQLVNQVDADAALFQQKVELTHAYQLHTMLETQRGTYPRRIRWLYRLMGGR